MLDLEKEVVGFAGCRLMNVVMEVGEPPEPGMELETSMNIDFNLIAQEGDPRPVGVDVLAYLRVDEGSVFSLDVSARVMFDIPDQFTEEEASEYLSKFGVTRAFDAIRPHMQYLSAFSGLEMIEIPPIVAEIE